MIRLGECTNKTYFEAISLLSVFRRRRDFCLNVFHYVSFNLEDLDPSTDFSFLVVELTRLLPLESGVLLLNSVIDKIAQGKSWCPVGHVRPESPEEVWNAFGDSASEGPLLHRAQVVAGLAPDLVELAEAGGHLGGRQLHPDLPDPSSRQWSPC